MGDIHFNRKSQRIYKKCFLIFQKIHLIVEFFSSSPNINNNVYNIHKITMILKLETYLSDKMDNLKIEPQWKSFWVIYY